MLLDIQPTSTVPIYEQIIAQVTYSIANGTLEPGTMVLSVRELADQLVINPNTVARAYRELEQCGLLEAQRGRGMEVTAAGPQLAQQKRQEIVRDRIRQALREGRLALPPEELRQVVEEELAHVNGKTTSRGETLMDPVIELRALTKHYRGRAVVDHLNLTVPRGAIYALLGENGAGKTTTIRMLTGQVPADSGVATILSLDCWKHAQGLRSKVGYVPERPKFYDWMTVHEVGWFCAGFQAQGYLERYQQACQHFELDPRAKLQILSKGQYAKVGLALALALDPEVLILDEPTSGLDLLVRREFLSHMVGLAGEGRTILISSHQIAEVERVASHAAFVHQGKLLLHGSLDDLRARIVRYRLRFADQAPDPGQLGQVLQRNGTGRQWQAVICDPIGARVQALREAEDIADFEEAPLTLEDLYCALLGKKEAQS